MISVSESDSSFSKETYMFVKPSAYSAITSFSFSFSSRWHCCARKGPYALRPVSQQSPQGCPRNSANICLVEHRSFSAFEGGMSAASFLHSSFLQAVNAVKLLVLTGSNTQTLRTCQYITRASSSDCTKKASQQDRFLRIGLIVTSSQSQNREKTIAS